VGNFPNGPGTEIFNRTFAEKYLAHSWLKNFHKISHTIPHIPPHSNPSSPLDPPTSPTPLSFATGKRTLAYIFLPVKKEFGLKN
jgi:hypothetical protein